MTGSTSVWRWLAFASGVCLLVHLMRRRLKIQVVFSPRRDSHEYLSSVYELVLPVIERPVSTQDKGDGPYGRPAEGPESRCDKQGGAS